MNLLKELMLLLMTFGFGTLSSAGVFTVLATIGLIPRFAGRMHLANKAVVLENMVILGTMAGCIVSVFDRYCMWGDYVSQHLAAQEADSWMYSDVWKLWEMVGQIGLAIFGIFGGMFIGALALAIAEMLNSYPISARRLGFKKGLSIVIMAIAAGKIVGSLWYFAESFFAQG